MGRTVPGAVRVASDCGCRAPEVAVHPLVMPLPSDRQRSTEGAAADGKIRHLANEWREMVYGCGLHRLKRPDAAWWRPRARLASSLATAGAIHRQKPSLPRRDCRRLLR